MNILLRLLIIPILIGLFILSLFSCGGNTENQQENDTTAVEETNASMEPVGAQLADAKQQDVFEKYIVLKDALVQTDADASQAAAKNLHQSLKDADAAEDLVSQVEEIASTNDVEAQRDAFSPVSNALIEHFKSQELASGTLYVQYCPMAFNDTGAYWLSKEEQVLNPYFGDKMLKCGRVTDKIGA
ncbi:MAG: DUF3347 domain-containing protein [Cyclobacteriaceae bacterium]|nr:DUF3347 domain-containing protein [Cyclobacteriaceae bacterium]MCH8515250.1 DUF3347 domain-containing protein [Cyclobacteriaceae bacterium]